METTGARVLILGAAGMIGRKLAVRLARDGRIGGAALGPMILADVVAPQAPRPGDTTLIADLTRPGTDERLISQRPSVIYHLAAVVSGEAEADFEKGYAVNLDGTRALFEAIRHAHRADGYCPRVIFTSSLAVYGAPLPDVIPDDHIRAPLSSYGIQKAMGELLLDDYTRRGFLDGIGLRLPTICIRPGAPNKAASGFYSSILREPLVGQEAVLPVPDTLRHWFASPRAAVAALVHAAGLDSSALGTRRTVTLPGVSATVAEQIEALRRVAGDAAVARIRREPDPAVLAIVGGWPRAFATTRADALGFTAEANMDAILAAHIEDELGGQL
jgi:nucleoside-diphosphate-sugar epimerase